MAYPARLRIRRGSLWPSGGDRGELWQKRRTLLRRGSAVVTAVGSAGQPDRPQDRDLGRGRETTTVGEEGGRLKRIVNYPDEMTAHLLAERVVSRVRRVVRSQKRIITRHRHSRNVREAAPRRSQAFVQSLDRRRGASITGFQSTGGLRRGIDWTIFREVVARVSAGLDR